MASVDSLSLGNAGKASGANTSMSAAAEVLSRPLPPEEGSHKTTLIRHAQAAAIELERVANPTAGEREALQRLKALISTLTAPAPLPEQKWAASGAAKARASSPVQHTAVASQGSASKQAVPSPPAAAKPEAPLSVDAAAGTASLKKAMTFAELAAAAFGEPTGQTHLSLLAQLNPSLDVKAAIPAGTKVDVSAMPVAVSARRAALTKGLTTIDEVLNEARAAPPGSAKALTVEQLAVLADQREQLVAESAALATFPAQDAAGKSEGYRRQAMVAYAASDPAKGTSLLASARQQLDDALKKATGGTSPILLKARAELSLTEASAAAQSPALQAYRESAGPKTNQALTSLPAGVQAETQKALTGVSEGFKKAKADHQTIAAQFRERAKTAGPEEKPRLEAVAAKIDGEISSLVTREQAALGSVHASVGNTAGQMASIRRELDSMLGQGSGALLKVDTRKDAGADGKPLRRGASPLEGATATRVGFMSPESLKTINERLAKLSPDQQNKALAIIANYGETAANSSASNIDAVDALNVSRQVLDAKAATDPKGPWSAQAQLTQANYLMQLGHHQEAAAVFRDAGVKAGAIADPVLKKSAETRAVMGEAVALGGATGEGNATEKAAAASALRALRQKTEARQPPLLDKAGLAQLTFMEVNGFLKPSKTQAEASLAYLQKTYGGNGPDGKPEVRWLSDSLKGFEAKNRKGGVEAFTQTLMAEMVGRQSAGEKFMIVVTGAAVGAAAGLSGGFGFGAFPGAIFGASGAGVGLLGANAFAGMSNAWAAGQYGLAGQNWVETLTDGVSIVTDIVGLAAPLKAASMLGGAGLRAAAGAADKEALAVLTGASVKVERALGSAEFSALSRDAREAAARKMLLKDFSLTTLKYGGITVPVTGLGTAAAGIAKGLTDIEDSPMSAGEKANARSQLWAGLGKALASSAPQMALQLALHASATSGLSSELRKAVTKAAAAKTAVVELSESAFAAKLTRAAEDEIKVQGLTGEAAASVRAQYKGIETNGMGFADVGTGQVYISGKMTAKARAEINAGLSGHAQSQTAKLGETLRHEVAHRDFHQLSLTARQKLAGAFESDPAKAKMLEQVKRDNPHFNELSTLQKIDEYQAWARAQSGSAGITGLSPTFDKALQDLGLKGVKELDVEKFLRDRKLDLGGYRPRSGERLAMGMGNSDETTAAIKALADQFDVVKRLAASVKGMTEVETGIAKFKPQRLTELNAVKSDEWKGVLVKGTPPDAQKALFNALQSDSPDALKGLLAKKPSEVVLEPTTIPKKWAGRGEDDYDIVNDAHVWGGMSSNPKVATMEDALDVAAINVFHGAYEAVAAGQNKTGPLSAFKTPGELLGAVADRVDSVRRNGAKMGAAELKALLGSSDAVVDKMFAPHSRTSLFDNVKAAVKTRELSDGQLAGLPQVLKTIEGDKVSIQVRRAAVETLDTILDKSLSTDEISKRLTNLNDAIGALSYQTLFTNGQPVNPDSVQALMRGLMSGNLDKGALSNVIMRQEVSKLIAAHTEDPVFLESLGRAAVSGKPLTGFDAPSAVLSALVGDKAKISSTAGTGWMPMDQALGEAGISIPVRDQLEKVGVAKLDQLVKTPGAPANLLEHAAALGEMGAANVSPADMVVRLTIAQRAQKIGIATSDFGAPDFIKNAQRLMASKVVALAAQGNEAKVTEAILALTGGKGMPLPPGIKKDALISSSTGSGREALTRLLASYGS